MTTTAMACDESDVKLESKLERLKDELACSLMQDAPRSKVSAIEDRMLPGLFVRLIYDLIEFSGRRRTCGSRLTGESLKRFLSRGTQALQLNPNSLQDRSGHAAFLIEKSQQQVYVFNRGVTSSRGQAERGLERFRSSDRQPVERNHSYSISTLFESALPTLLSLTLSTPSSRRALMRSRSMPGDSRNRR